MEKELEQEKEYFVGMLGTGIYYVAEIVDKEKMICKNLLRFAEMMTESGRPMLTSSADPFFSNDAGFWLKDNQFQFVRLTTDKSEKFIQEYESAVTHLQLKRSGLEMPGRNIKNKIMQGVDGLK